MSQMRNVSQECSRSASKEIHSDEDAMRKGECLGDERLFIEQYLTWPQEIEYLDFVVNMPAGEEWLSLQLAYDKVTDAFQLYGAVFDPEGNFRGHVQCPGGPGPRQLMILTGSRQATPGAIVGPISSGKWKIRIDFDRFTQSGEFTLRVSSGVGNFPLAPDIEENKSPYVIAEKELRCPTPEGWSAGELHAHSLHSDGAASITQIRDAARENSLDFVAISDHFTYSHWEEIAKLNERDGHTLLLPAIEVTTHRGHANLHKLKRWHDVYTDGKPWTFGDLAEEVHAEGGLICINHPYSGPQAWSRDDFDMTDADLIEVVNRSQGVNNIASIGLWDHLLNLGSRIYGVAGTDSHNPATPEGALGVATTVVKGDANEEDIYRALVKGHAYISVGGHLRLRMSDVRGGETVHMGETLKVSKDNTVEISADVATPVNANILIFKNGLLWKMIPVDETLEIKTVRVKDDKAIDGYYRAELHADPPTGFGASCWRTDESILAISNPIWTEHT